MRPLTSRQTAPASGAAGRHRAQSARGRRGGQSASATHAGPASQVRVLGLRAVVGAMAGGAVLVAGPGVTMAQARTGREQTTGSFHLRPVQASQCAWAVITLLQAELGDMAAGMPDHKASLTREVTARYAGNPTGLANVQLISTDLLTTATPDYFNSYNRDLNLELVGYTARIRNSCGV